MVHRARTRSVTTCWIHWGMNWLRPGPGQCWTVREGSETTEEEEEEEKVWFSNVSSKVWSLHFSLHRWIVHLWDASSMPLIGSPKSQGKIWRVRVELFQLDCVGLRSWHLKTSLLFDLHSPHISHHQTHQTSQFSGIPDEFCIIVQQTSITWVIFRVTSRSLRRHMYTIYMFPYVSSDLSSDLSIFDSDDHHFRRQFSGHRRVGISARPRQTPRGGRPNHPPSPSAGLRCWKWNLTNSELEMWWKRIKSWMG